LPKSLIKLKKKLRTGAKKWCSIKFKN
jgi:hypothetical protein